MDKQHSNNLLAICVLTCVALCAMAALLIGAKLYPPTAYAADSDEPVLVASSVSDQPANGIPALRLTIDPDEYQKMVNSPNHEYRATGATIDLDVPDGYMGEFSTTELADLENLSLEYIRGRGNSTWGEPKNPFKFKLDNKADLLGMGSTKHWVLLANMFDESLLRNRITSYIGRQLGLEFTPKMEPVDFYVNGKYMGSYVLCPQVRVGNASVDIDELGSGDQTGSTISGGYLVALEPYSEEAEINKFTTSRGVEFFLDNPDFSEMTDESRAALEAQRAYITSYLQKTEDALFADDMADENGVLYSDYMDLQSAASYWWVQEFSVNGDAFSTSSTYLYKKRDGKLYWGPLWDFDVAYSGWTTQEKMNSLCATQPMKWLDRMRAYDATYQEMLRDTWCNLDQILLNITKEGGVLDQYASEIERSWMADYELWNNEVDEEEFDWSIASLRNFLENRRNAVNQIVEKELTNVYAKIRFIYDGKVVKTIEFRRGAMLTDSDLPPDPEKAGYFFLGWSSGEEAEATNRRYYEDCDLQAVFVPEEEVIRPNDIFFSNYDCWAAQQSGTYDLSCIMKPDDVMDKRCAWSSSNPSVAALEGASTLRLLKAGETTITCTAHNGVSNSFTLHVYDRDVTPAQTATGMQVDRGSLVMKPGDYGQARYTLSPQPVNKYVFHKSSDSSVAEVDLSGIVQAVSPGECTITLTELYSGLKAQYAVTVLDPAAIAAAKEELAGKVIQASSTLASGSYTPESFAALKLAVDEANAAIDEEYATEARIAAARVELLRASRCLEPVDQAAAEEEAARYEAICELASTLTDLYENVDLANYRAASASRFRAALAAADAALADASSSSSQLREARASALLARKSLARKGANTLSARGKTVKAKAKRLGSKKLAFKKSRAFKVAGAKGRVTFQKVKGNKKISVSRAGRVTVKKGLKKGTYKVQVAVTAAGNGDYFPATRKVTVKVKVR